MLKLKVKKRRILLLIIIVSVIVFAGALRAVEYFGNQAIAEKRAVSKEQIAQLDNKIKQIKAKKAAELKAKLEAEKKAAEQSAAAEAA